jgi:regulator of nucleoside diphosphate kinase
MIVPNSQAILTETDHDRLTELARRHDCSEPTWRLRHHLRCGSIVEPEKVNGDVVTMNSIVCVRDLDTRRTATWTLVFPDDADVDANKLSVLAPLGLAILGARVGQTVEFQAPGSMRRVRIERMLYQPEAAGHYHL